MKDLYNKIKPVQVIAPVKVLDATVPAAVEVDLAGYNSAVVSINCGAKGGGDTGTITLTMDHADDDGTGVAGAYANVAAKDVQGITPVSGVIFTLAGGAVAAAITKIGYVGGKRFAKFTLAETDSNATGTMMAISLIKGHPADSPTL